LIPKPFKAIWTKEKITYEVYQEERKVMTGKRSLTGHYCCNDNA
jgi:hypothetical protein